MENLETLMHKDPVLELLRQAQEVVWINPEKTAENMRSCELGPRDIDEAEARLLRFAPLIQRYFPQTQPQNGLIESPLVEISMMKKCLQQKYGSDLTGRLLLKEDSHLEIGRAHV